MEFTGFSEMLEPFHGNFMVQKYWKISSQKTFVFLMFLDILRDSRMSTSIPFDKMQ
mgnify:CR=1 FL=1